MLAKRVLRPAQDTPQLASVCEAFSKDAAGVMQQQAENKQLLCEYPHMTTACQIQLALAGACRSANGTLHSRS